MKHPFDSIQEAIDISCQRGKILVREGVYYETISFLGNIDADPNFIQLGYWADPADPDLPPIEPYDPDAIWIDGDYHLMSEAGRWDMAILEWLFDEITSPCIDAGDPDTPWLKEPEPNGEWINLGAYGGTGQASMSPPFEGE